MCALIIHSTDKHVHSTASFGCSLFCC